MMNTRAKASILLGDERFGNAMREIERAAMRGNSVFIYLICG
jgi:hypothetical protein